jgi:gluconolactonase
VIFIAGKGLIYTPAPELLPNEVLMTVKGMLTVAMASLTVTTGWSQSPAGQRQGPGVQATQDARYQSVIAGCKNPPAAAAPRGAAPRGAAPAEIPPAREVIVTEIPGVIAAGQQWKQVWQAKGNVADGIVGMDDGSLLIAQNDLSTVLKLDKDGKTSVAYSDTNTGGALSINPKGQVFMVSRGIGTAVLQLAPQRKVLANRIQGDPLECIGGVINDITADGKGGAYFTMGGVFYASPAGEVTRYGENLTTNGIILSRDEKILYVTNGATVAAFDVQPNGSLTNQRTFVTLQGRGDGMTVDSAGRVYVTTPNGVEVVSPEGKSLGVIPTARNVITTAFGGPDKKTLFAVVSYGPREALNTEIISIPMLAQGFKGRPK